MTHGSGGKYTEGTVNPASTAYRLSEDMLVKNKQKIKVQLSNPMINVEQRFST